MSFFLWESSALVCPFSRENWAIICPPRLGSSRDEFERGIKILRSSAADESKLLEEDVLCLTSSDPAGSALLLFLSFLSLSAPRMKSCWKL